MEPVDQEELGIVLNLTNNEAPGEYGLNSYLFKKLVNYVYFPKNICNS
jgi:hypothetical protein